MLIGEYKHTLDDKKRISVPSKFRKILGKKVVITNGLDNCLFIYPIKEWEQIASKLSGLSWGTSDQRNFNRYILSSATEISIDSVGRILIPEHLKKTARIKTKVVFAGVYSRIEVWDEQTWEKHKEGVAKKADEVAERLGEIGAI